MLGSRLLAFLLIMAPAISPGHTDISETIKALSEKIAGKPTADLFFQRATEFRALRETGHAIEDFRSALTLEPKHRPATIALIQELGESDEALALALAFKNRSKPGPEATYILAKVHHLRGEKDEALTLLEQIQKQEENHTTGIDLLHSEILLDLGRPAEAAGILKKSWQRTNSIVLRNNWIDVALTAGRTEEVLPIIQEELSSSRFRSSWLIRRARAHFTMKKPAQARVDLAAALREITPRLNPRRPDLTLIADRGLIHALLGDTDPATRDLEQLKKSSLSPSSYRILSDHLSRK